MRRPLLAPERRTVTHFLPTSASTICSPFRRPFGISTASMLEAFIQYLSMWVSGLGTSRGFAFGFGKDGDCRQNRKFVWRNVAAACVTL